jgi:electron transfer flavoprotein alpha subunit
MGVSGQVQHMVGASDAKLIVAVNKDAKAPIFQNCDIGLVADMNKVVQQLTELF